MKRKTFEELNALRAEIELVKDTVQQTHNLLLHALLRPAARVAAEGTPPKPKLYNPPEESEK